MRRRLLLIGVLIINFVALLVLSQFGLRLVESGSPWTALTEPPLFRGWFAIDESEWWGYVGIPAVVVALSQICFLVPVVSPRAIASPRGKSLWWTVTAVGLVAGALTIGLVFAITELAQVFEPMVEWVAEDGLKPNLPVPIQHWMSTIWIWFFIVPAWLIWTPMLWSFARKRNTTRWGRWAGFLLAGTVLEVLVVLPIDVMVRRRSNCYCGTGSFFSLVISMWALLWLTGPGIVLAITSRRRHYWWETHCISCGYEKGPSPGERCPECGFGWANGSDRA